MPPDDGRMARAFQELDAKLRAWTEAVDAVHARYSAREIEVAAWRTTSTDKALVDAAKPAESALNATADDAACAETKKASCDAARPAEVRTSNAPPVSASEKHVDQNIGESVADAAKIEATSAHRDSISGKLTVETATADKTTEAKVETRQEAEALLAALAPDRAEAIRARHAYFKGRKTIRELIQEFEDEADDEESLLMSLDPELAKAVRVKYRLYNGRKTLREVIAEVEAAPPTQQPEKKSWWRK